MAQIKSEYPDDFTLTNGGLTMPSTVSVTATSFNEFSRHTVSPKQRVFVGNGRINLGVDDRGKYSAQVSDSTPTQQVGTFKLELEDANAVQSSFLRQDRSTTADPSGAGINLGKGGRTGNEKVLPFVSEDEAIVTKFKLDTGTATITLADSEVTLPVTVQIIG